MLANLTVNDIVLIDRLGIDFTAGLTVLTGETGAGKSILLDALALALGARGDAGLVRAGAARGQVTATFELPGAHPVLALLEERGIETEGAVVLRRVQSADGKTRAFLNDQPVSAGLLREVGARLVEIHGQHDDRALVDPGGHRRLLDAFGGLDPLAADVAERYRSVRHTRAEADRLASEIAEAEREADYLTACVAELEALAPEPGEEEALAERRRFLMQAEKIAGELTDAHEMIVGAASPVPDLAGVLRRLQRKAADMPELLDPAADALAAALDNLEAARAALEAAERTAAFDPRDLERSEERLFALRAAARKYRCTVDELNGVAAEFADRLAALDTGRERLAGMETAAAKALDAYRTAAGRLSEGRREAAGALTGAVNRELPPLKLEAAAFQVVQSSDKALVSPDGHDQIAFHVRTNPGTPAGPIMKIASGGELSRFLLALKVALADRGSAPTLVFDEIDTGAGGAVATAIGRRLGRLSEGVQVLAVTHAPQVAARADRHLLITKAGADSGKRVSTGITPLDGAMRREEIARMLSGATITDEARAAAERLIAGEADRAAFDRADARERVA